MPGYPSLEDNVVDGEEVQHKMRVLKDWLGHPYTEEDIDNAPQAVEGKTEMQALIAYLQNLGTALKKVR